MTNTCKCLSPTPSTQRALAIYGSQMGMVGLRVGLSGVNDNAGPLSVGGVLIDPQTGLPVVIGGETIGADGLPITPGGTGGGSTPGGVGVSAGAWSFTTTPATYTLQPGDTLYGLAITYLGNGARVMEIWNAQDASYKSSHTPAKVNAGDVLKMPKEASDTAAAKINAQGGQAPGLAKSSLARNLVIGGLVALGLAGGAVVIHNAAKKR
jgi:hypothetical protein